MTYASTIPSRVAYLIDAFRALESLPDEDLNEDADTTVLNTALLQRIDGLEALEVEMTIEADRLELARWIEAHEATIPACGHFILGYLSLPGLSQLLLDPTPPDTDRREIRIDLPNDMQTIARYGRIDASIDDIDIVVSPIDDMERKLALLNIEKYQPLPGMSSKVDSVEFGDATGKRHVVRDKHSCTVHYVLSVPGGFADVCLTSKKEFDTKFMESHLHTLSVR